VTDFVTVETAVTRLGQTYDANATSYTIYGLTVLTTTIASIVTAANEYVSGLSNTNPTSRQYANGVHAALALACMRVLVVASGGVLNGAVDYTLGDITMHKGTVTQLAFDGSVAAYKLEYEQALTNFTSGGVTANNKLGEHVPCRRDY